MSACVFYSDQPFFTRWRFQLQHLDLNSSMKSSEELGTEGCNCTARRRRGVGGLGASAAVAAGLTCICTDWARLFCILKLASAQDMGLSNEFQ